MTVRRAVAVFLFAVLCGAVVVVLVLNTDHNDAKVAWATVGPLVVLSFVGTGLYAWLRRPESRTGALMVALGFSWALSALGLANAALPYTLGLILGGLWGGVFLHLVMAFPSGRLTSRFDRACVIAGYLIFTVGSVPSMLFAGPHDLGCDECPTNVLLVHQDATLASAGFAFQALLYVVLFVTVLVRIVRRWRHAGAEERLQLTPVYTCGVLTFGLVTLGTAGVGSVVWWAAFAATALLPFAFLAGLARTHVAHLDAELRARLADLRDSRARLVHASDTERRRLERDLHDGAQARLVGIALLVAHARRNVDEKSEVAATLDRATAELKTALAELRELARGIHPAVLTQHGLEPAVEALVGRAAVPVTLEADGGERLPPPVEIAAYYVVCEALANVAKYSQAGEAWVTLRRTDERVIVDVTDDGIGGADASHGSGLRGLEDRLGALDGSIAVESPPGRGTHLHAEIPYVSERIATPS